MSKDHGKPAEGACCLATMEDITEEDGNYVEYQTYPSMLWHPAGYERSVIENLLRTQFPTFLEKVKTTDCQAELRRLLAAGPPIYLSDPHALPIPDGDTHICTLWFAGDDTDRPATLEGAPVDTDDRERLWEELKQFLVVEGKEEGDE